jgi:hypothetical protein
MRRQYVEDFTSEGTFRLASPRYYSLGYEAVS